MKKHYLKIMTFCIAFFAFFGVMNAFAKEYYWYCKRNSEHKQPILDSNFSFIESLGGIYVDKNHNENCDDKVIYLTFDAGYENGNVGKILDAMREEGVVGSFFILGNLIDKNPDLILRMVNEGHIVCNHTVNHVNLTSASLEKFKSEVLGLEEKYKALTGREMSKFFRPPEGTFSEEMLKNAQNLGYRTAFWSFAYADWDNGAQMSERAAMKKILYNIHNGEIMLLHPTSATNASIMKELIRELKAQGFRFATLEEI